MFKSWYWTYTTLTMALSSPYLWWYLVLNWAFHPEPIYIKLEHRSTTNPLTRTLLTSSLRYLKHQQGHSYEISLVHLDDKWPTSLQAASHSFLRHKAYTDPGTRKPGIQNTRSLSAWVRIYSPMMLPKEQHIVELESMKNQHPKLEWGFQGDQVVGSLQGAVINCYDRQHLGVCWIFYGKRNQYIIQPG